MSTPPKSRLGVLAEKMTKSGIDGHPVITDKELRELYDQYANAADIMHDLGIKPMVGLLRAESERIMGFILARKMG